MKTIKCYNDVEISGLSDKEGWAALLRAVSVGKKPDQSGKE